MGTTAEGGGAVLVDPPEPGAGEAPLLGDELSGVADPESVAAALLDAFPLLFTGADMPGAPVCTGAEGTPPPNVRRPVGSVAGL